MLDAERTFKGIHSNDITKDDDNLTIHCVAFVEPPVVTNWLKNSFKFT